MNFDYKRLVKFEHNVGEKEKKYRMMGGSALILISVFTAKILLLVLGMILVATGYSGWCPAYSGFGRNTCTPEETAPKS
ncbi:MAG: YgaP family membrane protein [Gammaproteobacteria bacterium]